jgi:UPF0271 protein
LLNLPALTSTVLDLNADVGENAGPSGRTQDAAILAMVTSANVACGLHAGDATTMRLTCEAAFARGVRVGAHVSYRDRANFGRRELDVKPEVVRRDTVEQLGALIEIAFAADGRVSYVKPHGALYNRAVVDRACAEALVDAISSVDAELAVLGPPGSALLDRAGAAGLAVAGEGFADRAYAPDGRLVSRSEPGSVLSRAAALAQGVTIACQGYVLTRTGERMALKVRSLCLHGDSPDARELAAQLREQLERSGVLLAPFT